MYSIFVDVVSVSLGFVGTLFILTEVVHFLLNQRKKAQRPSGSSVSIGFLHPHALSGGGGERVLWAAVDATQKKFPTAHILIYGAWPPAQSQEQLVKTARQKAQSHFGLDLGALIFEPVSIRDVVHLVDSSRYAHFTLVLQAVGMVVLGGLSFLRRPCDVVVDTANLTFGLIVPRVLGARTVAYVHYPTISSDMILTVKKRETGVHNDDTTAASSSRTAIKLVYYRIFAALYRLASWFVTDAMANSSWTKQHLAYVWQRDVPVVFPPCRTQLQVPGGARAEACRDKGAVVVSVGQFRPEKRHGEQLDILQKAVRKGVACELVMVGGARDGQDMARADGISKRARDDKLPVSVMLNASRNDLATCLQRGVVGLHTMRFEHFGIGVVELMVHGLIVIAHRSGGVAMDIVKDGENGFLANDVDEFARVLEKVVAMPEDERNVMRQKAVDSCARFSEQAFQDGFLHVVERSILRIR